MKNATATSHGNKRLLASEGPGESSAALGEASFFIGFASVQLDNAGSKGVRGYSLLDAIATFRAAAITEADSVRSPLRFAILWEARNYLPSK
jgi:hypothetical protein